MPTISLNSAFSTGGHYTSKSEVVFYAGEDIFRDSVVGTRELAIKKYCKCKFDLDTSRTYESYCFEFCGLLNIRHADIRFLFGRKELQQNRIVRKATEILVYYNKGYQAFRHVGDYALGPAFSALLEKGLYSDVSIDINGQILKAHKCILVARSR